MLTGGFAKKNDVVPNNNDNNNKPSKASKIKTHKTLKDQRWAEKQTGGLELRKRLKNQERERFS